MTTGSVGRFAGSPPRPSGCRRKKDQCCSCLGRCLEWGYPRLISISIDGMVNIGWWPNRPAEQNRTAAACPAGDRLHGALSGVYVWSIWRYSATRTDVDFDFLSTTDYLDDGYGGSYFDYARSIAIRPTTAQPGPWLWRPWARTTSPRSLLLEGPRVTAAIAPEIAGPCGTNVDPGTFGGIGCRSHVAGAAALVQQAFGLLGPGGGVTSRPTPSAGDPGPDNQYGYGLLRLPAPPASADGFVDVPPGHPYASAIAELSARNIIGGYDKNHFGPEDAVMRQQFAKMIVLSLALEPLPAEQCPFGDVGADWPYPAATSPPSRSAASPPEPLPARSLRGTASAGRRWLTMVVRALDNLRPVPSWRLRALLSAHWATSAPFTLPAMTKAEHNGVLPHDRLRTFLGPLEERHSGRSGPDAVERAASAAMNPGEARTASSSGASRLGPRTIMPSDR